MRLKLLGIDTYTAIKHIQGRPVTGLSMDEIKALQAKSNDIAH